MEKEFATGKGIVTKHFLDLLELKISRENAYFEGDSKQGLGTQNLKKCVKEGLCC